MKLIIAVLSILLLSTPAFAQKSPKLKLCTNGNTIIAKKKCAANEALINLSMLAGVPGPQGFQGPAGIPGASLLSSSQCNFRNNTVVGSGFLLVTAACLVDEYVAAHGMYSSGASYIDSVRLDVADNGLIGEAPGLVTYVVSSGGANTITVQAWCCRGTL